MDKEVKRSLLLWPAIASTAIIAATTLPLCWNTPATDSIRLVATGTSSLSTLVRWTGSMMHGHTDTHAFAQPVEGPLVIAGSEMARSLSASSHTGRVEHRVDCGSRGLALPARLGPNGLGGNSNDENGVSSSASADLVASNKVIARTLLAPVLDPVAELAGYSGLASTRESSRLGSSTLSNVGPRVPLALPSRLSPGLEDPLVATGNDSPNTGFNRWMHSLDPIASWDAIAMGKTLAAQPALLNETTRSLIPGSLVPDSLIPRSVEYLARPSFESAETAANDSTEALRVPPRTFKLVGNAWPQPKQLCRDLALIAADADIARLATSGERHTYASVELGTPRSTVTRDLVADGNLQKVDGQAVSPIHRNATAIVMGRWADKVETTIDELQSLPRISDARSGVLIRQLSALSEAGLQLAERAPSRQQQVRWLRAAHATSRRTAVWGPIWHLAREGDATDSAKPNAEGQYLSLVLLDSNNASLVTQVANQVQILRAELNETGDEMGWETFLLLDAIESASASSDSDNRALIAQRFLSRLDHHLLTAEHREWLSRPSVRSLAEAIQVWTVRPVDYTELLNDLERGETDAIDLSAIKVGEVFQSLRFSNDEAAAKVAKAIDINYRNANVRTAISVKLIDRLLPPVAPRTNPIRTQLLGNDVRGTSNVSSQLGLSLIPSRDSWNLNVRTFGNVQTNSHSGQSGVTVLTSGHSVFDASTPLQVRPNGYTIGSTNVDVSGGQHLAGVRSKYDGWPLVGSLVRGIAESRFEEARPLANRKSSQQIRTEVTNELQTQLTQKTAMGQAKLDEFVFGPLGHLNLQPKVIDLRTTHERLIARYRLAGDWQLASNTPRPRAWNDSWMSLQVHQSALNNTLEQLLPTGNAKSFGEFFEETMALFGRTGGQLPEDVPADALIEFAATRPITVEMEEGRLTLTLRVVSLSQPEKASLNRFIVRAAYRPEIDGLSAKLVRDGHLSISGPGMSMRQRFPIRALFNKVLSESRTIPLTMPRLIDHPATQDLAISQLELRDGWLAFAISPNTSPRVAVGTRALSSIDQVITR